MASSKDSLNCVFHKNRVRWLILNVHFPVTRIVFYSPRCNALELHNIRYNLRKSNPKKSRYLVRVKFTFMKALTRNGMNAARYYYFIQFYYRTTCY